MADYYPLLAKALAGLPNTTTPAARQAIYDRARKALIGQLRSLKPPLAEDVIAREEAALDAAVARLEGERGAPIADDASPTSSPEPAPRPAPPRPPSAGPASAAAPPRSAPPSAPPNRPTVAPAAAPRTPTPAPTAPRYAPPPRPPSAPSAPTRPVVARSATPTAPTAAVRAEPPPLATTNAARAAAAAPSPQIQGPTAEPEEYEDQAPPIAAESYENASAPPIRAIGDSGRPAAPGMNPPRPSRPWLWISLALFAIVVVASAAFAFLWREKPSDLAINDNSNKAPVVDAPAKNAAAGQNKIAERVSGGDATQGQPPSQPSPTAPANTPSAPASPTSPAPGAPNANGETPIPTVTVPTVPMHGNDAGNAQTATANPPASNTPAQARAALLIETPNDPQKPKVDIGTAVWTLLPAASGPAQGAGPAVQAEIDIPEMKMHATMTIRKNVDASLPATHTIDLRFAFADGADTKGFKDMALPQLRRDDTPTGDAVSGVRVKINDAYYLVGLTRSDADTTRNLDLLSSRNWLDFPLLFNDDHVAKLTFEKGAAGQSVIAQAIDAWK
jgi:hypothetical protein